MRTVCGYLFAFALAAVGVAQADRLDNGSVLERFNRRVLELVAVMERADLPEAEAAYADYQRMVEALSTERDVLVRRRERALTATQEQELDAENERLYRAFRRYAELNWLGKDETLSLVRSLAALTKEERTERILLLTQEAASDTEFERDELPYGGCGTYDHTYEYRASWAIKRYPEEAHEALKQQKCRSKGFILGRLTECNPKGLTQTLLALTSDPSAQVRGSALLALARTRPDLLAKPLLTAFEDEYAFVRYSAVSAAGVGKCSEAVSSLITMLDNGDAASMEGEVLEALGSIGTQQALARVRSYLVADGDLQWYAANAVELAKDKLAVLPLKLLLAAEARKGYLLEALVSIDPDAAKDVIIRALEERDEELLSVAIRAVCDLRMRECISILRDLLPSLDEYDKASADQVLKKLQDPPAES